MSTAHQYGQFNAAAAAAVQTAGRYAPSQQVLTLQLLLDVPNLSPWTILKRLSLILANDVETNPGPHQPSSVFASEPANSFVFTNKSVRMSMAYITI